MVSGKLEDVDSMGSSWLLCSCSQVGCRVLVQWTADLCRNGLLRPVSTFSFIICLLNLTCWCRDPTYLLKAVQESQAKGFPIYVISVQVCCFFHFVYVLHILTGRQNEPQYSNSPYPTCTMTPDVDGRIGRLLRALLNSVGLTSVKLIGYEVRLFISPQCSKLGCT